MASFPFMKLPPELRNKIYACCLLVEGHILSPDAECWRYDPRLVYRDDKLRSVSGILSLSKAVHQEAAPIFYGKNTFRVSITLMDLNHYCEWDQADEIEKFIGPGHRDQYRIDNTYWSEKAHLIRRVSVYYHYTPWYLMDENFSNVSTPHPVGIKRLKIDRSVKMQHLWNLQNLTTLEMNFSGVHCQFGGCRIELLGRIFTDHLPTWFIQSNTRIVLEGLETEAELALMEIVRKETPHCTIVHVPSSS